MTRYKVVHTSPHRWDVFIEKTGRFGRVYWEHYTYEDTEQDVIAVVNNLKRWEAEAADEKAAQAAHVVTETIY
jgi:hypothetical protein